MQKMKRQIMEQSRRMNVNFREHQAVVEQRDANIKQLEQRMLQLQQKVRGGRNPVLANPSSHKQTSKRTHSFSAVRGR